LKQEEEASKNRRKDVEIQSGKIVFFKRLFRGEEQVEETEAEMFSSVKVVELQLKGLTGEVI